MSSGRLTLQTMKLDYLKDVEKLELWSDSSDPTVAGMKQHFLNAELFSAHRSSLFSLLSDAQRKLMAGTATPYYYLKTTNSLYRMHVEQCFFWFFNHCFGGASYWYLIWDDEESLAALDRFIAYKAQQE